MTKQQNEVATVIYEIDGNEIKLTPNIVKEYIVGDKNANVTMQEFKLFTELCKVRQLNPFLKEAYLIKFGNSPAQIVVGKDAILKRALQHPKFNGREQGIIVLKEDGSIEERAGTFRLPNEQLVGAWAKVYRKDWEYPTYISVSFDEVAQKTKQGNLNSNWENKGATMVEKVALVRALRETFTEDLGGMVDIDEAWEKEPKQEEIIIQQDEPEILDAEVLEEAQMSLDDAIK